MAYSIVTIPRTGSHYLQERLLQHTGVLIQKYHDPQPTKIITIARDPKDTLASDLSMSSFFYGIDNIKEDIKNIIPVVQTLSEYLLNADIIIDYDDLIHFPYETTKALANAIGAKMEVDTYKTKILDDPKNGHMISSKNFGEYQNIRTLLDAYDFSGLYDIYHKMLAKAIDIKPSSVL
jgi:hypothetical protein